MIKKKFKNIFKNAFKNLKKRSVQFFLIFAVVGLIVGVFSTFNFLGESDKEIRMGKIKLSSLDIERTYNVLSSFYPEKTSSEIKQDAIEWMMYKEALVKKANDANLRIADKQVSDFIKNTSIFHENGNFSSDMYSTFLEEKNIKPKFYEELVRDELKINLLKSYISEEDFSNTKDIQLIDEKLTKEWDISYLVFDTSKIKNHKITKKEIEDAYKNSDFFNNLEVNVVLYEVNRHTKTQGFENIIKNKDNVTDDLLRKNGFKPINRSTKSISALRKEGLKIPSVKTKYVIDSLNEEVYLLTLPENVNADDIEAQLLLNSQIGKKMDFAKEYTNNLLNENKDFKYIAQTQNYISYDKALLNRNNIFINDYIDDLIKKSKENSIHYFLNDDKIIVVKTNSIKISGDNREVNTQINENYSQNMKIFFLNLLDKRASQEL